MTPQNENSASFTARSAHQRTTARATGIEAAVCDDIALRQALGIAKYGTTVADNPLELRAWLQHAYEETLDKAIYLKRAIAEIDRRERQTDEFLPGLRHKLASLVKQAHEAAPPGEWAPIEPSPMFFKAMTASEIEAKMFGARQELERAFADAATTGLGWVRVERISPDQVRKPLQCVGVPGNACTGPLNDHGCRYCAPRAWFNDELPACTQAVDRSNHPDHP